MLLISLLAWVCCASVAAAGPLCAESLELVCGNEEKEGVAKCLACAGQHASSLHKSCTGAQIESLCKGGLNPPPPLSEFYVACTTLTAVSFASSMRGGLITVAACGAAPCGGGYINVSNAWRSVKNKGAEQDGPGGRATNCTWSIPTPTKGAKLGMTDAQSATDSPGAGCITGYYTATGLGGGPWYRFVGAGGDALPTTPPGGSHCGTQGAGWLSGWAHGDLRCNGTSGSYRPPPCGPAGEGGLCGGSLNQGTPDRCMPPKDYKVAGAYPAAGAHAPTNVTVCSDMNSPTDPKWMKPEYCDSPVVAGVVRCEAGFLLWRLPYARLCGSGYCTAPSGGGFDHNGL